MTHTPKTILITGASSGLGKALAYAYAAQGVTLLLTGRNSEYLQEVEKHCTEKGAKVKNKSLDIIDKKALEEWIVEEDSLHPIDLVIANAGISGGTAGGVESVGQVEKIMAVNVNGVFHTIHPIIPLMQRRKKGQIAIMSSLAGYRGLPSAPAYSASKAAVKIYGEALRGNLSKDGVGVTVITPGYIKTPMTDINPFPMPFLMEVEKAANIIKNRLAYNPARIAFPFPLYATVWLMSCLPPFITDPIFSWLPSKPSIEE